MCPENADLARLRVAIRVLILKWTRKEDEDPSDPFRKGQALAYEQCSKELVMFVESLDLPMPPDDLVRDVLLDVLQNQSELN